MTDIAGVRAPALLAGGASIGVKVLGVVFSTPESFEKEYHANLSKGGLFVATDESHELRTTVEIGIELAFAGRSFTFEGEVVHCVPKELAAAGAVPGVAVQLKNAIGELNDLFGEFVSGNRPSPKPTLPKGAERRRTERGTARVHARVCTQDGRQLEGLTRDVSQGGILFSLTGDPLPVKEKVEIFVTEPGSGRQMQIPGMVMRHAKDKNGQVNAMGIQFTPPAGRKVEVVAFLRELEQAEHSRRLGGITGAIAELGLGNLLQTLSMSSPRGTLAVMRDGEEGFIAFGDGQLIGAQVGRVVGTKALARMLCWTDGSFEFHARVDSELACGESISLQAAMLDAARQADEAQASAAPTVDMTAVLRVDEVASAAAGEIGKVEEAVLDLLRVDSPLARIVDVIPEPDSEIHRAIANLLEQGLVVEG
jgi:Tfp pilus assembly protein PilZ